MSKIKNKKILIGGCIILAVLLLLLVLAGLGGKNIARGVYAAGVNLSGLSASAAEERLQANADEAALNNELHLILGEKSKTLRPSDFLAAYDYAKTAEAAMEYGKTGNIFSRIGKNIGAFFGKRDIGMQLSYDEAAYADALDELLSDVGEKVTEYSFEAVEDKLHVTTGTPGQMPDTDSVSAAILHAIARADYDDTIRFEKETRNPREINVDTLYDEVYAEAADASYTIEDGKVVLTDHVVGMQFNKDEARPIIEAHRGFGETYEIPLQIEHPAVTREDIEAKLFSEIIGEFSTKFNAGDVGRSKNISLATNKINGTILAPDEVFSYNGVVGERSYSEGYQTAKVYVNGETVDGVGGGICQVSSTLFNAVVYANLEIVERVNHQLTVSYVPLGRDATVDYGNIDFRFKNSTKYPIKIVGTANGGTMYMAIYGYKEDKSEKVTFETNTIAHTEPREKKVDDPTLPKGEEKIVSKGGSGYVVETYKVVSRSGHDPERTFLCRSTYQGAMRVINVGTGEPQAVVPTPGAYPVPPVAPPTPPTQVPSTTDSVPTAEPTVAPTAAPAPAPVAPPTAVSDTGL